MAAADGLVIDGVNLERQFFIVIQSFERIQIGTDFGESQLACRLRLGVLKLRLCRWHDAVTKLIGPLGQVMNEQDVRAFNFCLESIDRAFKDKECRENSPKPDTSDKELGPDAGGLNWMVTKLETLSSGHWQPNSKTESHTPTPEEPRGAIDKKSAFENLITNVAKLAEWLEEPIQPKQSSPLTSMRAKDAGELGDRSKVNESELQFLRESATDVDKRFIDLLVERTGHLYLGMDNLGRLHSGDYVAKGWSGPLDAKPNTYHDAKMGKGSSTHLGTNYGGEYVLQRNDGREDHSGEDHSREDHSKDHK